MLKLVLVSSPPNPERLGSIVNVKNTSRSSVYEKQLRKPNDNGSRNPSKLIDENAGGRRISLDKVRPLRTPQELALEASDPHRLKFGLR